MLLLKAAVGSPCNKHVISLTEYSNCEVCVVTTVCWCSVTVYSLPIAGSEGMFSLPFRELLRNGDFTGMQDKTNLSHCIYPNLRQPSPNETSDNKKQFTLNFIEFMLRAHKTHATSLTLHYTQHTSRSTVSLCTTHNTHTALQSHSALHTTHMPPYSLTLHYTQHTCRSTVSLCTAHNTHASTHSALHTTYMPLLTLHYTQHTCRYSLCTAHNTHAATHSALHTTHMPLYDMLPHHLIYITT